MPGNKTKVNRIHDQLPSLFKSRQNINWKALVEAIGTEDQATADLVEEVRKQFFVKTATRPYIDILASNNLISRPKFIGMDDTTFRTYIPVLSYQPKQVKLIIDSLLDIFFFKESTTAFVTTKIAEPFVLQDGWTLEYKVDSYKDEIVTFKSSDFVNINSVTAEEVAAAMNRQTKYSFAIVNADPISKQNYVRIFTNTVGAKGSILITGGTAIIGLHPDGFIDASGNGNNTEWTVSKVGDEVTFQNTAGNDPGIQNLDTGDIFISNLLDNKGSFAITKVDIANQLFTFTNLFGTPGVYTQTSANDTKFLRPFKFVVWVQNRRAVSWEVKPGQIVVETPTSPPVVKRALAGSAHINGTVQLMTNRDSDTSLSVVDGSKFPDFGTFFIEEVQEIKTRILTGSENTIISKDNSTRLISQMEKFTYTGKTGNMLTGITPNLPEVASLFEFNLSSLSRDASNIGTAVTTSANGYKVGEYVVINGSTDGAPVTVTLNGTWLITEIVDDFTFKFFSFGDAGTASGGVSRVERIALSNSGSKIVLSSSQIGTRILGPNMFDLNAAFVLSSLTTSISDSIQAGKIVRTLSIGANSIPNAEGFVVFDYGKENQEGPIRYLFKPTPTSIALDPAYVFQFEHSAGSAITMIRTKGPHVISLNGAEYAAYITDTTVARQILQELILSVKSVGIFVDFLVRFPEQIYATVDVYGSGVDPG